MKQFRKIVPIGLAAIVASISLISSVSAATPRYDENGNICGYDYSIDEINMDKLKKLIENGSKSGDISVEIGLYTDDELVSVNNIDHEFDTIVDADGNSCVQLRPISETVGFAVDWNGTDETVTLSKNDTISHSRTQNHSSTQMAER